MLFLNTRTGLKQDAIIGLIFTGFFGIGLFMVSLNPVAVDLQAITMGNILAIAPGDVIQLVLISTVSLAILLMKWRDLMLVFFDETHARTIGLHPNRMKALFLHPAGGLDRGGDADRRRFLVIALVVTPGPRPIC